MALNPKIRLCDCGEEPVRLTVKKDTPNKGRIFYKCPKPEGEQCKFYIWDDEQPEDVRRAMAHLSDGRGGPSSRQGIRGKENPRPGCARGKLKRSQVESSAHVIRSRVVWIFTITKNNSLDCII